MRVRIEFEERSRRIITLDVDDAFDVKVGDDADWLAEEIDDHYDESVEVDGGGIIEPIVIEVEK